MYLHNRISGKKLAAIIAAASVFALNHIPAMTALRELPEAVYAENRYELSERLGSLGFGEADMTAASSLDSSLGVFTYEYGIPGVITLKSIPVFVAQRPALVPGGRAVGISIYTDGVLIVGLSSFIDENGNTVSPAENAGLAAGDIILKLDGVPVSDSAELARIIESAEGSVSLLIDRGGSKTVVALTPVRDAAGRLRIGAWIRDSTIGVGTLSFYDEGSGLLAALGHPVTDADTGSLLRVRDGKIVSADIVGVTRGVQGAPGELHGTFGSESMVLGSIECNTPLGVGGRLDEGAAAFIGGESIPSAFPDEVHTGEAFIICAASGEPKAYSCRIVKTSKQGEPEPKGLVVEITDEELLELTGGIVQGMSGSPIIQDGRLAGAITHVFVNDPKKGYGAYAYWMYKELGGQQ